ncbi:MAG: hypothetical protein LBN02_09455 [Oscillospiraceae bacterium]|jgi:hypothetical protein|nr:hypothetical protein [Oscillospiraceae bacterium]
MPNIFEKHYKSAEYMRGIAETLPEKLEPELRRKAEQYASAADEYTAAADYLDAAEQAERCREIWQTLSEREIAVRDADKARSVLRRKAEIICFALLPITALLLAAAGNVDNLVWLGFPLKTLLWIASGLTGAGLITAVAVIIGMSKRDAVDTALQRGNNPQKAK